jgi:FlaA1/EpsC-like NDP-sugar epimerase
MIVVTLSGASGFLGTGLIDRFLKLGYEVHALGHSEKKTVEGNKNCSWAIGDITDKEFCKDNIKGDLVIHCAAQKHIPIAEKNPEFSIKNNILGTLNVFQSALDNKVKEVVFISTDKAYEPETIYGMTKSVGEWLCEYFNKKGKTKFYWCRYGNVIKSAGSIFEIWDREGRHGRALKITDPEMTRFFFTLDEAIDTVLETLKRKYTNKPYIPKMKAINMGLACDVFSDYYGVMVEVIGNRGNEKTHEAMSEKYRSNTCKRFSRKEFIRLMKKTGSLG